jgi:NTP pyrophosphatase (non-canonical NTP hydrolase)
MVPLLVRGNFTRNSDENTMADATTTVAELKELLRQFAAARNWQVFHTPKNLAMALATEVGELLEPFLWLTGEQSQRICFDPKWRESIADEMADVFSLLLQLSIHSGIDLSEAIQMKLAKNEQKYPADRVWTTDRDR